MEGIDGALLLGNLLARLLQAFGHPERSSGETISRAFGRRGAQYCASEIIDLSYRRQNSSSSSRPSPRYPFRLTRGS